jgi:Mitochondrial ATP synthase epsilon chain
MSYLKYSNLCADMVRAALKEPLKGKAREREIVYFKEALWKDGKPEKSGGLCMEILDVSRAVWPRSHVGLWGARSPRQPS